MRAQRGGDKGTKIEWTPAHRRNALGVFAEPSPLSEVARRANAIGVRLVLVDERETFAAFIATTGNEAFVATNMTKLERGRFNDWFGEAIVDTLLGARE